MIMQRRIDRFKRWREDNVPPGKVYLWLYGDGGRLVVEVRKSDKLYNVTGYYHVGGSKGFERAFTHRYRTIEDALQSAHAEEEKF